MAWLEKSKEHISENKTSKLSWIEWEVQAKIASVIEFYSNPKNKELIKERNELGEKVIEYLNENLPLSYEERTRPFTI